MDDKVIKLQDASGVKAAPNEVAIQRAEELLQLAKDGELRGFIVIGETVDDALFEGGAQIFNLPLIVLGLNMAMARLVAMAEESA